MPKRAKSHDVFGAKSPKKSPSSKSTVSNLKNFAQSPQSVTSRSQSSIASSPISLRHLRLPTLQWKKSGSGSPTSILPSDCSSDLEAGDMKQPLSPPEPEKSLSENSSLSAVEDQFCFVRRVCRLLAAQVLLVAVLAKSLYCATDYELRKLEARFVIITVLSILGLVVVMSCCCRHAAQKTPMNILCLLGVTILQTLGFGILMTVWEAQTVLLALCLVVIVLGVLLCYYTFFTAGSFDTAGPYLITVWAVVGAWPPIMFFLTNGHIPQRAAAGVVVLLFCFHVICDLQRMVRKSYRGHDFETTEHIFAVLSIYLDVVTPTSPLCD